MSKKVNFSRKDVKLKLDYAAMGKILVSPEMDAYVKEVAEGMAASLKSREPDARVEAPINPENQNRSRYYVVFTDRTPRERNQLLAAAFRGAKAENKK